MAYVATKLGDVFACFKFKLLFQLKTEMRVGGLLINVKLQSVVG